jgi:hypothetical protein
MSALNIICQRDRVIMVTDGACWDVNTGIVSGYPCKQATMPVLPAVLATRGSPLATPILAHLLGNKFQTFDALVTGIEGMICGVHKELKSWCRDHGDTDEPVVIAGWSRDRNRPEAYMLSMTEEVSSGETVEETAEIRATAVRPPPYKLHALSGIMYSPFVPREAYEQTGIDGACNMDEPIINSISGGNNVARGNLSHPNRPVVRSMGVATSRAAAAARLLS